MKAMEARGEPPPLPPIADRYLVDWWLEIGPTSPSSMGEGPISWSDIAAWQRLALIDLLPWEATAIRRLSIAYLGQRHDAKEPSCPAPYRPHEQPEEVRATVDRQFQAMIAALGKRRKE
jgi:hypothetical protein